MRRGPRGDDHRGAARGAGPGIRFKDVSISARSGARLAETEGVRMTGVRIVPASGPVLTQSATRDLIVE